MSSQQGKMRTVRENTIFTKDLFSRTSQLREQAAGSTFWNHYNTETAILVAWTIVEKAPIAEMMNSFEILKSFFSILEASQPHTMLFAKRLVSLGSVYMEEHLELSWRVKVFSFQKGSACCLVIICSSCMTALYFSRWQSVRSFAITEGSWAIKGVQM